MSLPRICYAIQRLKEQVADVELEAAKLEMELDGFDHREAFEKCKTALAVLYYDGSYSSRSKHVNEYLDDPEIQEWIRSKA